MSEQERYQFLDRSLDNFFEIMAREKLHDSFYEFCATLGYGAVSEYLLDPNNYQIILPNDNTLDIAQEVPDKLPVTALALGESVEINSGKHPLQSGNSQRDEPVVREVSLHRDDAVISVWASQEIINSTEDELSLESYQPVFIANDSPDYKKNGKLCPTSIGHELIHLAQSLSPNEQRFSTSTLEYELAILELNHEIEAYAYQSQLFDPMLYDIGRITSVDMAGVIDSIRRAKIPDGYQANDDFLEKARMDEFARRILPAALSQPAIAS